jgi:anti-sigma B factor antagonist
MTSPDAPLTQTSVSVVEERGAGMTVLRLTGELDMAGAPEVLRRVDTLIAAGDPRVLVDLSGLTFCDSAGLNAFIRGDRHCREAGGWLRLTGATGHVDRVIELSGLAEVLGYRPDVP